MAEHSLDSVTIDGFRGLKSLRLDNLGLINVLVGPNNCGKTSVLEALSILCNAFEPFEWLSMVRRRDFGGLDETRIQSLRWCFSQTGQLADPDTVFGGECVMSCSGLFPLRTLRAAYSEIEDIPVLGELDRASKWRSSNGSHQLNLEPSRCAVITQSFEADGSLLRSGQSVAVPVILQVWEDYPNKLARPGRRRSRAPTETLTPYSYQINRVQVSSHSRQVFDKNRPQVLELVRDFDPDIQGVEVASFRGNRPAIYLDHKRLGPAPLSIFGDALRRAVLLASTLPTLKDGGILLIDEVETGIHFSVLQRVFKWLTKAAHDLRVQIFATTHSLEAVDAIAMAIPESLSELVTFHLDQTEQETRVKRFDGELLLRLRRERGLDVR
jgi:AAA domain, putative AbiEii toxin, Type IV TA system/AAA ATPase domain